VRRKGPVEARQNAGRRKKKLFGGGGRSSFNPENGKEDEAESWAIEMNFR
jgi:hypothetical protein